METFFLQAEFLAGGVDVPVVLRPDNSGMDTAGKPHSMSSDDHSVCCVLCAMLWVIELNGGELKFS
jgi:hypothetical protein